MGYIAQKIETKEIFYSKGANKIADLIGCHASTITKNAQFEYTEKVYNGFVFAKTIDLSNRNRGISPKAFKRSY